jgi:hypothetical protein
MQVEARCLHFFAHIQLVFSHTHTHSPFLFLYFFSFPLAGIKWEDMYDEDMLSRALFPVFSELTGASEDAGLPNCERLVLVGCEDSAWVLHAFLCEVSRTMNPVNETGRQSVFDRSIDRSGGRADGRTNESQIIKPDEQTEEIGMVACGSQLCSLHYSSPSLPPSLPPFQL